MKKVRDGIGGEVTAEIFETWFPYMSYNEPELFLRDFLASNSPMITIIKKLETGDWMVSRITPKYAKALLEEFKVLRGRK